MLDTSSVTTTLSILNLSSAGFTLTSTIVTVSRLSTINYAPTTFQFQFVIPHYLMDGTFFMRIQVSTLQTVTGLTVTETTNKFLASITTAISTDNKYIVNYLFYASDFLSFLFFEPTDPTKVTQPIV